MNKWIEQGRTWVKQMGWGRRIVFGALTVWLVGALLWVAAVDVLAAIELAYFRGTSTNTSVLLEWATIREVNLNGFEILCKRAVEPDTAYHPIGSRIAQGGPEIGAVYSFNVTAGLAFGESYCFRLREVTADNVPGEVFELCGYGPGVSPTPTVPGAVITTTLPITIGVAVSPTAIVVEGVPGVEVPTLIPTETPTLDPALQQQPLSPLPVPGATTDPSLNTQGFVPPVPPTPTFDPFATPTPDPAFFTPTPDPALFTPTPDPLLAIPSETPTWTPMPTETPTITPTATLTPTVQAVDANAGEPTAEIAAIPEGGNGAGAGVEVTPTPLYVVVTATPTPEGLAVILPTFTPWPTSTPTPGFSFANVLAPSTQNMMVMLLCLIFVSASGLGALGLVTSVLYMRSQSRRDRYPSPYDRRRF